MARARGNPRVPVVEVLREEGYAFDFFQAVRILEAMRPEAPAVGTTSDPSQESVRFHADPSLSFPASEIVEVRIPDAAGAPAEMVVSFFGLSGEQGPLPHPFTELLLERIAARDTAARDFLDIFNHRLVSLVYRAREKHRVGLRIQLPERSRAADVGFSLMGLGGAALRDRMNVRDRSLLFYAGTLSHGRRTAVGLEGLLSDYFGVLLRRGKGTHPGRIRVREFVGRWHTLEADQVTALGVRDGRCRLGVDAVIGRRVWDQSGMIEVAVGPLDYGSFQRFLPGGDALAPLRDMIAFYLKGDVDFLIRPILHAPEVPETVLTAGPHAARLGLTSWLKTRPFVRDADDVVLRSRVAAPQT
jgi:type VI secretion system protein ImpH